MSPGTTKSDTPTGPSKQGRPPKTNRDAIVEAGVLVGLPDLKIKTVADKLGVAATALYHHVSDLKELRHLVGSEIASTIELPAATPDSVDYLVLLGSALRKAEIQHAGIGQFFVVEGQTCEVTKDLMSRSAAQLTATGLSPTDSYMLGSIVANTAFGFATREREEPDGPAKDLGDAMLSWVVTNLASALITDLDAAPWNQSLRLP